jgi:hypothetical protein
MACQRPRPCSHVAATSCWGPLALVAPVVLLHAAVAMASICPSCQQCSTNIMLSGGSQHA